jgi:hypothetical protein
MLLRSTTKLLILASVQIPPALTAQEVELPFPVPVVSFTDVAAGPVSLTLPQSSGEKSPAVAALLNALLFPGIGNFYAGNSGHGLRHVALAVGGGAILLAGFGKVYGEGQNEGDGLALAGLLVVSGNWVWSIFSGIGDARAAGSSGGPGGGVASIVQPKLSLLGLPRAVGDPPGVTTHRLDLQLLHVAF